MPKFHIEASRRQWQYESVEFDVEAKNAAEARKIARGRLATDSALQDKWSADGGDSGYDDHTVEVEPTKG